MDVCDVKATGEDGSVSQHDGQSKEHPLMRIVMLRLWINRVASEIAFQLFHTDTSARCTFFLRDVTVACATVTS